MAKMRSPNYPALTIREAIDRARRVYDAEHTHSATREVVAKDLGYSSLSGASLPVIGALRRYGLLIDAGDGMKVSDDAITVLELPDTDPTHREALVRLAFAPDLFADLRSEFGEKLPSDANLRHYLIRQKFLPKAADEVIRVYRDNLELVGFQDEAYNGGVEHQTQSSQSRGPQPPPPPTMDRQSANSKPTELALEKGFRRDVCSLDEGPVTLQWPESLALNSIEDLQDWLATVVKKIKRNAQRDLGGDSTE